MATMHCPHCHVHTSITPTNTGGGTQAATQDDFRGLWWIGRCNNCKNFVLVHNEGNTIWPSPFPSPTAKEIPQSVRENLLEAKRCASVNAWRAGVVMCRRALQMACIDKGASDSDNLVAQINQLKANSVITADLHEWATVVRWVGNDGAHPGGAQVDKEDAENMLDLTEQFLHVLYVAPAKAAAHRAKLGK